MHMWTSWSPPGCILPLVKPAWATYKLQKWLAWLAEKNHQTYPTVQIFCILIVSSCWLDNSRLRRFRFHGSFFSILSGLDKYNMKWKHSQVYRSTKKVQYLCLVGFSCRLQKSTECVSIAVTDEEVPAPAPTAQQARHRWVVKIAGEAYPIQLWILIRKGFSITGGLSWNSKAF